MHAFMEVADVLTRRAEQRYIGEGKRNVLAGVTVDDTSLIAPEDFANDTVVEPIPRPLLVVCQFLVPFHT